MFDFIGLGNGLINVLLLLVFLVVLVVIHELGHFIVARRSGVHVHEFGIGFPPRAKVLGTDSKGTEYTLNWLPIGGFVKLEGEEGESVERDAFVNKPLRTRVAILLAGVLMNILLAFVVFSFIAGFADPSVSVRIASVQADSPAEAAGLHGGSQTGTVKDENGQDVPVYDTSGDQILAVDGHQFPWFEDPQAIVLYLRDHPSTTVTLLIQHADGTRQEVQATTRSQADIDANRGALGFTPQAYLASDNIKRDPLAAIAIGFSRTLDASTVVLRGLGDLIVNITRPQVSGPVGIAGAIGAIRENYPPVFLLWLFGALSANLAVVNVLPFPPLDGSRVAVAIIQRLTGNRISVAAERLAYLTGFVLLMALLVWITFFDIQRLG
jgi:regulator of sigma E protease